MTKYTWTYDVEVFPNVFTVIFQSYQTREFRIFYIHEGRDERIQLDTFLREEVSNLASYNGLGYDRLIMNGVLWGMTNLDLYGLSHNIIHRDRNEPLWKDSKLSKYNKPILKLEDVDLMKLHAFDKLGVSLKKVGVSLNMPNIMEFESDWDLDFDLSKLDKLIEYNKNDVETTTALLEKSISDLKLRRSITNEYGVDVMSASGSKIANVILEDYYEKHSGIEKKIFKKLRTERPFVDFSEFTDGFTYTQPLIQKAYETIKSTVVFQDDKFSYKVKTKYVEHQGGMGGLHSIHPEALIHKKDDKYRYFEIDASGYYPSMMVKHEIRPQHLGQAFTHALKAIIKDRMIAKRTKNKMRDQTLKLSSNSIFGKLGDEHYFLKDDKALYTTTILGQLYILQGIDRFEEHEGIECIQSNTDGFVIRVRHDKINLMHQLVKAYDDETGLVWEPSEYTLLVQRNVNVYYWQSLDGNIKAKGAFSSEIDIKKGFKHPIVPKALEEYFINGIPPETTINNETDIYKFCISQKVHRKFEVFYQDLTGRKAIQRVNRYFVSKRSGAIIKYDRETNKSIALVAKTNVYLLNEFNKEIDYFKLLDKSHYIRECNKVISEFEIKQLKLF